MEHKIKELTERKIVCTCTWGMHLDCGIEMSKPQMQDYMLDAFARHLKELKDKR